MLVVKILVAVLVLAVAAVLVLRMRKIGRDRSRVHAVRIDRRLLSPPPSPYTPSKGFRLLDGSSPDGTSEPTVRSEPARPRLEPDHDYVFSDAQLPAYDVVNLAHLRHDEHWALSRSARRGGLSPSGIRVLVIVVVVAVAVLIGTFYLNQHSTTKPTVSTTTQPVSTTTSTLPAG